MTVPVVRFSAADQGPATGFCRGHTVVFDGSCGTCTRLAQVLRGWDRRRELEVVTSEAPGIAVRFPWIPPRDYRNALQFIRADGCTFQGAAAIEQLINVLPKGSLISWIFKIPGVRGLAARFYRWFATNRYRLGCGQHDPSPPFDADPGA